MSHTSPFVVTLSEADRGALERQARSYTSTHAQVIRAKIVLFAADGQANMAIAQRVDVHVDVVSRWRKRFCAQGLTGLADRARSGRPRAFAAGVVAQVKAMACEPPAQREVPLARWSSSELARQAHAEGLVVRVSASTVRRWLAEARDQAVAVPLVDLPARPRLCGQGRPRARPLWAHLGGSFRSAPTST